VILQTREQDPGAYSDTHEASISNAFTSIYAQHSWGKDGEGSGPGSSLEFTRSARLIMELVVLRHKIIRFMDIPCGSSHWWPPLLQDIRKRVPSFNYLGMDVVESVIANSNTKYANDPLTNFRVADVSIEPLPQEWDLVLSRDALQHLPLLDAINVLDNIAKSKPRFLLVGSYVEISGGNKDIKAGDYFHINLLESPFNIEIFDEQTPSKYPAKYLILYSREQLQSFNFEAMRTRAKKLM
jgi:hypothetical protein